VRSVHAFFIDGRRFQSVLSFQSDQSRSTRDGLEEMDVHDVLNVFMCTGFTRDTNQYFTKPSPVEVGDYIEFLVETDLLVLRRRIFWSVRRRVLREM